MIFESFKLAISSLLSIYSVNWIFLKVLKIAKMKGIVDSPNLRKIQKSPVPVLGGLAVFFGVLMGMLLFCSINEDKKDFLSPLLLSSGILLFLGAMDDILNLTPKSRLVIEIVVILGMIYYSGICIDSLHGLWGVNSFSWWIAVPLTVFAGVGIINAYNMVDGVNGLSSGLCISCSLIYFCVFFEREDYLDCALAICFGASLLPFFLHNVFGKRSRMYIGDSGTMVMGIFMTWFTIVILNSENNNYIGNGDPLISNRSFGAVAFVLSVASVPVFDALRVITMRLFLGRSPFVGDKTHLHHIFLITGFSHLFTAISEILINVVVVLSWYLSYYFCLSIELQLYVSIVASLLCVCGTYFILRRHATRRSSLFYLITKISACTQLEHKKWWIRLQQLLDRDAFEDYRLIIVNRKNKSIDDLTKIELFESSIVNYMQGRNAVKLSDLRDEGLVEDQYFEIVIASLVEKNVLECLKRDMLGKIEIVHIVKGSI